VKDGSGARGAEDRFIFYFFRFHEENPYVRRYLLGRWISVDINTSSVSQILYAIMMECVHCFNFVKRGGVCLCDRPASIELIRFHSSTVNSYVLHSTKRTNYLSVRCGCAYDWQR